MKKAVFLLLCQMVWQLSVAQTPAATTTMPATSYVDTLSISPCDSTTIPIDIENGIVADVKYNNKTVKMLFDTGCSFHCYIEKNLADSIGVRMLSDIGFAETSGRSMSIITLLDRTVGGPIIESVCFIGLLQKPLSKHVKPLQAILATAVIFSLLHFKISLIPHTLIEGLFFSYVYYKTNRLIYPILIHSSANLPTSFFTCSLHEIDGFSFLTVALVVATCVISLRYVIRYKNKA